MLRALSLGSPPPWNDVPPEFQLDLAGLEKIDDDALWLVGMRCVASLWVVTLARPGKEQRAYYLTGIRAAPAD